MTYKILIVEDNNLNLKLFTDLLNIKNYNVIQSLDGLDLLAMVLDEVPDLILMDIQMKNISGTNLIRDLKNHHETKNTPIIAITALTFSKDIDRIIKSGCNAYIPKPVAMDNFYRTIEEFLPAINSHF